MWVKKYFDEFQVGHTRKTAGRTITEADIVLHAGQTGDFFPHHMDEAWCKTQPFGRRIAHGTLIFSVAVGLTADQVNEVSMTYGYERLRFIRPVFIGDTIKVEVTVTDVRAHKRPAYGLVVESLQAYNQNNELVLVCDHILLVERKQAIKSDG
ncbi:MAG TPA: MaoC/PaaZ C-terminal domain-containing protein [Puia sp.]|nr:MaoC/PaaZ C-terminal domain-containing protein [Puia sp.]